MPENFITGKEKVTFRDIVLQHLKDILKISQNEFMGGYWKTVVKQGISTDEYVPDSRQCYIQAIENFAYVLLPHFDNEMEDKYKKLIGIIRMSTLKFREEYNEEILKQHNETVGGKVTAQQMAEEVNSLFTLKKLENVKELFEELNCLMKRADYLKTSIYSEEIEEEEITDIDKEKKE